MHVTPSIVANITRTARSGDTLRAWRMFDAAGLGDSVHPDVLSLRGRLLKDKGLQASGADRTELLEEAEATYLASAGERRATYPLINAATIAFLNAKPDRARDLARRTIELLDSGSHEPETQYWLAATRAEAAFLLGDLAAGERAIKQAITVAPDAWEDQAATLRQLEALLVKAGEPTHLLEPLRPPPCLHFGGLIGLVQDDRQTIAAIEQVLDEIQPGFVYGALAAGTDISVAELAVARGAQLHVVLPMAADAFRAKSVAPYGDEWVRRFDRLVEQAAEIETLTENDRFSAAGIVLSEDIAMGLAIRRSRTLASRVSALRVRRASDPPALSDIAWQALGLPFRDIVVERSEAPAEHDPGSGALRSVAVLASNQPSADVPPLPVDALSGVVGGRAVVILPDLAAAADIAIRLIAAYPDIQCGLDYRVIDSGGEPLADAGLAISLARAAPAGSILAACPGALALELRAPALRFEAAGEIVTPIGDVAVSLYSRPA